MPLTYKEMHKGDVGIIFIFTISQFALPIVKHKLNRYIYYPCLLITL